MAEAPPSTASPGLPEFPPLDNTLGAVLVGTAVASMFCGLSIHQTYRYFRTYQSDAYYLKIMVSTLCLLDAVHELMAIHLCYYYMVTNYFNPVRLQSGVWSLRLIVLVTGVVATITHLFFSRRVFILSVRQRLYPLVASILVAAELAFCLTATIVTFIDVTFESFQEHSAWIVYTALGVRVLTDVVLTATLIYYLQRSRTGFTGTDSMIDVLILYAINTGLVTR
ncbi:hypothetical protein C8Q80DRAFT_1269797 [Daedaleopsis nitida]|nr:hypothetical protein C8Q80DRAFT_1269797 [Daedaleopsis nitida]